MSYDEFIMQIVEQTGYTAAVVKAILNGVPDALIRLSPRERLRTPLGVFTMTRREGRAITRPDGVPAIVEEKLIVKLKPGLRLQRDPAHRDPAHR